MTPLRITISLFHFSLRVLCICDRIFHHDPRKERSSIRARFLREPQKATHKIDVPPFLTNKTRYWPLNITTSIRHPHNKPSAPLGECQGCYSKQAPHNKVLTHYPIYVAKPAASPVTQTSLTPYEKVKTNYRHIISVSSQAPYSLPRTLYHSSHRKSPWQTIRRPPSALFSISPPSYVYKYTVSSSVVWSSKSPSPALLPLGQQLLPIDITHVSHRAQRGSLPFVRRNNSSGDGSRSVTYSCPRLLPRRY